LAKAPVEKELLRRRKRGGTWKVNPGDFA